MYICLWKDALVFGTFPSKESLANKEYYSNPKNHFWDFLFRILDSKWNYFDVVQGNVSYTRKKELIQANGIALWDVVESCVRVDNRDSSIKDEKVNDVNEFLREHSTIQRLIFTEKAFHFYKKGRSGISTDHRIKILNSTSSLNPNNTFFVLNQWRNELVKNHYSV